MLSRRGALAALAARAVCGQNRGAAMFGDAEAYERFMGRWSTKLAPRLVEFTGLGERGKVLDVGSGTGSLAFAVARLKPGCEVTGIDPSAEYVAYAKSRNPFPGRVGFETGDAQQLRFGAAAFAHSVSLLVFNFIPDRQKALREVIRVTEPGGRVAAAVWDYGDGMRMLRVYWDAVIAVDGTAQKLDEAHMPLCRQGELKQFWQEGGLQQVEERPLEATMEFERFADYWEPFLLGQGPAGAYLRKQDEARRQAIRGEVLRRLKVAGEGAPFSLPARVWAVRGTVARRG